MEAAGMTSDFFQNSRQSFASYDWTTMPSSQEEKIVSNKFEHSFFNLYNRIFYQLNFHSNLFLIIMGITHFQSLFGNTMFTDDKFYNVLVNILEFAKTSGMEIYEFYIYGYVYFAITVVIYLFIIGSNWYLWKRNHIPNFCLVIISLCVFGICPLLINPTSYLIKRLLGFVLIMSSYLKDPDNSTHVYFLSNYRNDDYEINKDSITRSDVNLLIVLLVFVIIALILQFILIYYSFKLLSMTIYLPYHPLTGLSISNVLYQIYFQPIIRFFELIFAFYPKWVLYILHITKIILFSLSLLFVFIVPLILNAMNSLMLAFSIAGTVVSIIKLVFIQHQSDIIYIHYLCIILSYVVVAIVVYIVLRTTIKKKYKPLLAYNHEVNICDLPLDKRFAIVKTMKNANKDELIANRVFDEGRVEPIDTEDNNQFKYIFRNITNRLKLLFFIKTGIENGCDLFVDNTLFNFLINFSRDRQLLEFLLIIEMGFPEMRFYSPRILGDLKADKMKFDERFLMFGINKLQMITETECSTASNEEINMARINSTQFQDVIMQSWYLDKLSLSALENVTATINKGQNLWDSIIIKYPNLIEAHALYLNFLTECRTDFYEASQIKKKLTRIQEHKLTKQDKCFIVMMQTFPFYITRNILTIYGTLLDYTNIESQYLYNDDEDLGDDSEDFNEISDYDSIAKSFLTLPKLRLAVYKATHHLKPSSSYYLNFIIYLFFILFLVAEIALTAYYYNSPTDGMSNSQILKCYRYLQSNVSLATSYIIIKYGSSVSSGAKEEYDDYKFIFNFFDYYTYNDTDAMFETNPDTLDPCIFNASMKILYSFQGLIQQIQYLDANSQYDVEPIIDNLFNNPVPVPVCYEAVPINPIYEDLQQAVIFFSQNSIDLAQDLDDVIDWFSNNNEFCNVFSIYEYLCDILIESRTNTFDKYMTSNLKQQDDILLISILVSVIMAVIFLAAFLFVSLRFLKELRVFVSILSSFDDDTKRTGTVPISLPEVLPQYMRNAYNNDANNNSEDKNNDKNFIPVRYRSKKVVYYSMVFLCCLLIVIQCAFIFSIGYTAYQMSSLDLTVTFWSFYNRLRISQFLELFSSLSLTIVLQTNPSNATNYDRERLHAMDVIQSMEDASYELVTTTENGESILGYYDDFDTYYLETTCLDTTTTAKSLAGINSHQISKLLANEFDYLIDNTTLYTDEEFECMSMSQKILIYIQIARDILQKIEKNLQSPALNEFIMSRIAYLYHIMNKYLCSDIEEGNELIVDINDYYMSNYQTQMLILLIFSILFSIIAFFIAHQFKAFLESIFHGGIILVRRLNPNGIASNHQMITFLLNKEIETKNTKKQMPVNQSIMYHSQNMIFYLTNEGIIEGVNDQAIINNLSYSSDQILGKPIQSLVDEESKKEIQKQLVALEKNDQGITEINVIMYTATMMDIYAAMLMLRTSSGHIIAIVTNQNETIDKQKIAQEMKDNSLALLNHILPPCIVDRLNKNEKDISFTVQSATILMVDISHFTEFSRTLSPEQILGTLSTIFNMFEKKMEDYQTLTKIKTIGDIYICCGGLFGVPKELLQTAEIQLKPSISENFASAPDTPQPKAKISTSLSSVAAFNLPLLNPFANFIPIPEAEPPETKHLSKLNKTAAYASMTNIDFKLNMLPLDLFNEHNPTENDNPSARSNQNAPDITPTPQNTQQSEDVFVANQAIRFGLDIIELIDDFNMKNNTCLQIRLGISTGGPIIAGLLGVDLLDFEIFGEQVELAETLDQVGIPGKILISENTYNLISNYDYSIDPRSDVYMKGKGTIHAYVVNPESANYSQSY